MGQDERKELAGQIRQVQEVLHGIIAVKRSRLFMNFPGKANHGHEIPQQAFETNSKARCGALDPPLCGIVPNSD